MGSGLIRFALRNPYAVLAAALGLCLLSATVIVSIPMDVLPDFRTPVVVSFFSYPGLPSGEMEKSVTERIERVHTLAGGLAHQESRSLPGAAIIKVFFHPGTDPSSAMNDIVNLENSDFYHLPPGIEYPFTMRGDPGMLPVALAAVSGEGLSESQLFSVGYYAVRNHMGGLQGVQVPHPFGGRYRQMMVYVDPGRLQSLGLSARDVVDALRQSNLVLAAGTVRLGDFDYQVHPSNTLLTTEDIEAVPIAVRGGRPIFIRDVGYARDDAALQYNIVRVNGQRSVYVPLLREPGRNTIAVVDRIRKAVRDDIPPMKARGDIPQAAEVSLLSDQSVYIRSAMRNLLYEVGLGALLVTLVVAAFLRRLLPTLAIVAVILLSVLASGLGFYFTGHTINVMTLGGLALAVGTVVDVGIVVVENIVRHMRLGKTPGEAARDGAAEVAMPVLAGTVTTLAVFIPAIFLTGMVQALFEPLSVAATLTIGASYFIGMTVVPAFCAQFVRQRLGRPGTSHTEDEIPEPRGAYAGLLGAAFKARWLLIAGVGVLVGGSLLLLPGIGSELFPTVDGGTFELRVKTAPGTRLEKTEELVAEVEDTIRRVIPPHEIETIIANLGLQVGKGAGFSTVLTSNSGPDTAFLVVNLRQQGRRTSTQQYVRRLRRVLEREHPYEKFLFVSGDLINAALNEGSPVPINIQVSAGSLEKCREKAEQIVRHVRRIPGAADVQIGQQLDAPQLDIEVDRTRARYLGLSQEEVAQTILTALGSSVGYAPTIWVDPATGTDFFMGVQYESNELESLDEIRNIPLSLQTSNGPTTIPLSNIATIRRVNVPAEIKHYNIARVYDVYVNVAGRDVGSVADDVERTVAALPSEPGVTVTLRGPVVNMRAGARLLGVGLAVATALVYLVMMAQFRSFVDPLIVVLAVPLGMAGVLAMLYLTGTTLNIQSLIGTLIMIGVAVNNSILLVEFANQLRERGYAVRRAALAAAQIRLRPILMTALVLVASMLPLSVQLAPGGEAMIPLARAVIGGMLVSTALTLLLVPCVYTLLKRDPVPPAVAAE